MDYFKTIAFLALITGIISVSAYFKKANANVERAQATVYTQEDVRLGNVEFEKVPEGVKITATLENLPPNEKLGFHVHEKGECEGDFSSAGGHFNPTNLPHGTPGADSHVGDLGNLETNDEGVADFSYVSEQMTLDESKTSVLGKAIIIHGGTDDFDTQPSGDSGHRIACGVIQSI